MTQVMLYVLPMILGRTFDMAKDQVGVDIFPGDVATSPVVISKATSETHYRLVDSTHEARDFLDVSGSFSLKVKAGFFKAGASGSYLSDTADRENTVEVLVRALYETVTETLPARARPKPDWQLTAGHSTHYVRSISYGGELLATVRLRCKGSRSKQQVKASLELGGRIKIFDVEGQVEGEYLKDVAEMVEETDIKVFSSVPLSFVPHSMSDLERLLDVFADDVKRFNDGKGVPLRAELWPLTTLDSTRIHFLQNRALEVRIQDFEERMDDLLNARQAVEDWMRNLEGVLTPEQEEQVGKFYSHVEEVLDEFYKVIGNLDVTGPTEQLQNALEAYGGSLPNSFYTEYLTLRKEVTKDVLTRQHTRSRGATYIYWGNFSCGYLGADVVHRGYGGGSSAKSGGGGSDLLCLTHEPDLKDKGSEQSVVRGLHFIIGLNEQDSGPLKCALCRLPLHGAVQMIPAARTCPAGWTRLYGGLLTEQTSPVDGNAPICLSDKRTVDNSAAHPDDPAVNISWAEVGQPHMIPCVMCAL